MSCTFSISHFQIWVLLTMLSSNYYIKELKGLKSRISSREKCLVYTREKDRFTYPYTYIREKNMLYRLTCKIFWISYFYISLSAASTNKIPNHFFTIKRREKFTRHNNVATVYFFSLQRLPRAAPVRLIHCCWVRNCTERKYIIRTFKL